MADGEEELERMVRTVSISFHISQHIAGSILQKEKKMKKKKTQNMHN
jgi:hypothetical protein